MTVDELISRLDGVRRSGSGWKAKCPAHADSDPSLSIREGERGLLVHCFAGCPVEDIIAALELAMRDLFTDTPTPRGQLPRSRAPKTSYEGLAFQFDLAALDRQLRADAVLKAATNFYIDELSEYQLNRLLTAVAHAYADRDHAEFLEAVADDFRLKAFQKREERHAA